VISLDDYNAMIETLYLMKSPKNYQRLLGSIENIKEGKFTKKDLLEE